MEKADMQINMFNIIPFVLTHNNNNNYISALL